MLRQIAMRRSVLGLLWGAAVCWAALGGGAGRRGVLCLDTAGFRVVVLALYVLRVRLGVEN